MAGGNKVLDGATILNAVVLVLAGLWLHFSPHTIMNLFHNDPESLSRETFAILQGWGSALLALGIVGVQAGTFHNFTFKVVFNRAMLVFWALMAHGNLKVILSHSEKAKAWNAAPTYIQFLGELALSLLSAYCGVFAREAHSHAH